MPLRINKDGRQLGPFSLEEARALVLSGELTAEDWAWPDGAKEWVALKDVPGFAGGPAVAVAKTPASAPAVSPSAEEELWRGHPSQLLNFGTYFFCALALVASVGLALFLADSHGWVLSVVAVVMAFAVVLSCVAFFRLRATEYVVTTQRVRVIAGLLAKDIHEIELFRVKDTAARQSFLMRLFGLGTITILSGDENLPRLVLNGVPRAVELRERLRQEVMTLRQRFGVREYDVM